MLRVRCYSDYKVNQRPVSFTMGNREFIIKAVLDQWYSPNSVYFKVRDEKNHTYILKYDQRKDLWELEFFEKGEE